MLIAAMVAGGSCGAWTAEAAKADNANRGGPAVIADQEKPREKAKPHHQKLREAKELAQKNFRAGVEKSIAKFPAISEGSKSMLRSTAAHQSWIENTISESRKQTERSTKEAREAAELAALASWSEARVEEFMDTMLTYRMEEEKNRKKDAEAMAKKKKKGGENTPPPNGGFIQGGGNMLIGQ
jgi:hypothetical protein